MLANSRAKYIQSLGQKKARDEEGVFIAEGPKIVDELLASGKSGIQHLYALQDWIEANHDKCSGIPLVEVDETDLQRISQLTTSNQVLAVVKKYETPGHIVTTGKRLLALDMIQDPGNLGTIIRICDWFGVEQIICSRDCADMYNPKVVQSTMGSFVRVSLFYTDLDQWLGQQRGVTVYAAALAGKDVTEMDKIPEGVIVIGNESKGIRPEVIKKVDEYITIPRRGKAESLNAAVATGIILSHLT